MLSKCLKNAVIGCQEMVHCKFFFLTPNRNMFSGKFVKWEKFLIVFREHIIFNIKWVEVHKISEVFWVKPYWKRIISFASFCCLWDFLLEIWNQEKTPMMSTAPYEKKLYIQNNIFKKRIPDMRCWIIYNLVQISFFGRLLKGVLASVFFLFSPSANHGGQHFYPVPPP